MSSVDVSIWRGLATFIEWLSLLLRLGRVRVFLISSVVRTPVLGSIQRCRWSPRSCSQWSARPSRNEALGYTVTGARICRVTVKVVPSF